MEILYLWEQEDNPNFYISGYTKKQEKTVALWIVLLFISGGAVIILTDVDRKRITASK